MVVEANPIVENRSDGKYLVISDYKLREIKSLGALESFLTFFDFSLLISSGKCSRYGYITFYWIEKILGL